MNHPLKPCTTTTECSFQKRLIPITDNHLIKVIAGQRRTGKSILLRQIMDLVKEQYPEKQIIYINKEDYAWDAIKPIRI